MIAEVGGLVVGFVDYEDDMLKEVKEEKKLRSKNG